MTALFSALEVAGDTDSAGFRLDRLELLNWGTFHGKVWQLSPGGANALLTGDIGSGKSTLVDAVTTLLVPAHRIAYNKAAGADTRERSLRSYVLGYYKSERNELTGTTRAVALRDGSSYSVLLAVFANRELDEVVSLAQVFRANPANPGQPDRWYVVADRELGIAEDFADFGDQLAALRKRLRASGARVHDTFPEYGKDFRRRLGIPSPQALDLFHQTVSMKSVGDLNEFVRTHMLERFDTQSWIDRLLAHFDDLTRAHEAVRRARDQLAALEPLLDDCRKHERLQDRLVDLTAQKQALRYYVADRRAALLREQLRRLEDETDVVQRAARAAEDRLSALRQRRERLVEARAGCGGDRLAQVERDLAAAEQARESRQAKFGRFNQLLAEAGLAALDDLAQLVPRRREIAALSTATEAALVAVRGNQIEAGVAERAAQAESATLNEEIVSLRQRRSNIPLDNLRVRRDLCAGIGLPEPALPFAGELIAVRAEARDWEGAAERVLHGFALSLLVPQEHYPAVAQWVDAHHLNARLVYHRVPAAVVPRPSSVPAEALLHRLELKDSPFSVWLEQELARRADYACVDTVEQFRQAQRAVTRAGQIKGGGRHEKDDRRRIDDRAGYVLGWSNEAKIDALLSRAVALQRRLDDIAGQRQRLAAEAGDLDRRQAALSRLSEFRDDSELDWPAAVRLISDLHEERRALEAGSQELARLTGELADVDARTGRVAGERDDLTKRLGAIDARAGRAREDLAAAEQALADPGAQEGRQRFPALDERLGDTELRQPDDVDRWAVGVRDALEQTLETTRGKQSGLGRRIVAQMGEFRRTYPLETVELDDSLAAISGYRELRARLAGDDLPRFEAEFKGYLNTNTIRDIAGFHAQLSKEANLIRERIAMINDSLRAIEYNEGRFIRLEAVPTANLEIRDFRAELRQCTDNSLTGEDSDAYGEAKFLQVQRILARFRGREGQSDADKAWTRHVTDVRNWFTFSASERWREDDTEYEHYSDSGGKSGGQKEKLAYTILAASLAYQFKLDPGSRRSKTFRFVVIDEAFGRGSDESTRFALRLFGTLGLQLLIVTPLQKIHVIEPFVSAVGFVDNRAGDYSRLQTLTVEEYRQRRALHAAERAGVAGEHGVASA